MTRTQRSLVVAFGVANAVVWAAAAFLLWYVWPVLVEPPETLASDIELVATLPALERPLEAAQAGAALQPLGALPAPDQEDREAVPLLAVPQTDHVIESVPAPAETPEPTPTPMTLVWPSKEGQGKSAGGWDEPAAMPSVALSPQQVNIVLMGADFRQGQAHWRTDTIVVVTVDPNDMKMSMISIPRDLWVHVPGYGSERINTADFMGERAGLNKNRAELLKKTIQMNLGIPIHYYVRVNYDAFEKIINTLGGVTVQVDCPLEDVFPNKRSPTGWSRFAIKPGIYHMNGWTALLYARLRKSTNDFNRSRRQHAIMRGVWQGALAADVLRDGPRLYTVLKDSVQTDLGLQDMLALGYVAVRVRPENIRSYFIDNTCVQSWTTPGGAAVLLPIQSRVKEVVAAMFAKQEVETAKPSSKAKVRVVDGASNPNRANLAASQLRWKGLKVVNVEPGSGKNRAETVVVDYGSSNNASALRKICETFGVASSAVKREPNPASGVDYEVIVGIDYDPCQMK